MKWLLIVVLAIIAALLVQAIYFPAHAASWHRWHHHRVHHHPHYSHAGGRPRAWCGYYMRGRLGVRDPSYNLARNWAHYGHAASPHVGAIVVWPHHVGLIVGRSHSGEWIIESGNDGNRVRSRPLSVRGAIAFREVSL